MPVRSPLSTPTRLAWLFVVATVVCIGGAIAALVSDASPAITPVDRASIFLWLSCACAASSTILGASGMRGSWSSVVSRDRAVRMALLPTLAPFWFGVLALIGQVMFLLPILTAS